MELTRTVKNILSATAQQLAGQYISFDRFNVATLSEYFRGAGVGTHQDDEKEQANDIIVSISFGKQAEFRWGPTKGGAKQSIRIGHGDLVIFDRNLWHEVPTQSNTGEDWNRLNVTFRIFNLKWYGWKGEMWAPKRNPQADNSRAPAKKARKEITERKTSKSMVTRE